MELFEFKRYTGDDTLSSNQKSGLNEYLEEVKARKRKRLEVNEEPPIEVIESVSEPVIDRSKKKRKNKGVQSAGDALSNYLEEVASRRKRREAKEITQEGTFENDTNNENIDSEMSIESKLKKKLKKVDEISDENNHDSNSFIPEEIPETVPKESKIKKKSLDSTDTENEIEFETKDKKVKKSKVSQDSSQTEEKKELEGDGKSENESDEEPKKKRKKKKKKKKKVTNENNKDELLEDRIIPVQVENKPVTFEVLGAHSFKDKVKVKRVLPRWLAEPTIISTELASGSSVKDVGRLHHIILQNLETMGIKELFPVQLAVIPHQLKSLKSVHYLWPRDVCVSAPTGSGKTLAYVLPMLQAYYELSKSSFYCLVVVPVQELALQVTKVFKDVSKGTGIKIACVTGGTDREAEANSLVYKKEDKTYQNIVNILVATPGRLMEHYFLTPGFSVNNLKFIVIDEADRIVEQKSLNWLHLIEKTCNPEFNGSQPPVTYHNLTHCKRGPQKLLFSATLSQDPEKLLKLNLFQPKLITSVVKSKVYNTDNKDQFYGKFTTPASLRENYVVCEIDKKPLVVHKLLAEGWRSVLIFAKSCLEANRLCQLLQFLNPLVKIEELTSHMVLGKRQMVVNQFGRGLIEVLVCSDRLARGIDIKGVDYVIIYDPPKYAKGYIHKAGRTGRAGVEGTALSILTPKQSIIFLEMLNKAGKTDIEKIDINESDLEQYEERYKEALLSLKISVTAQKTSKLNHIIKEKRSKTTFNIKKRKRII